MKWIGQHIWDFISRFRSDVYLENVADGAVANDKFLGLDANNKIVKETVSTTVTDLHSAGVDGSANQILTDNGDGTVTSESTCLFDTGVGQQFWVSGTAPYINVSNSANNDEPGRLQFWNMRGGAVGVDGDGIGQMNFIGNDSGSNATSFARIESSIVTALHTDEAGKVELTVAASNGTTTGLQQALTATGHGTNNTIDIGLGYGTESTTTIAGDLATLGDDISMSSASNGKPLVTLKATDTSRIHSAELRFLKDADNVEDGEILGKISFHGDNDAGTPEVVSYAEIVGRVNDMSDGAEEGVLGLYVASHDGELQPGIYIYSGDAEDKVDVLIGTGTDSLMRTAGRASFSSYVTMENGSATGQPALYINNLDADQSAIKIEGTNNSSRIIDIDASALTTGNAIYINDDTYERATGLISLDVLDTHVTTLNRGDFALFNIFYERPSGSPVGPGQSLVAAGANIRMDDNATNDGTFTQTGLNIHVDSASTNGSITNTGITTRVGGGDENRDIKMINNADDSEYAEIYVGAGGSMKIDTTSDDTTGHISLQADGDINLQTASGAITGNAASYTFSNSAAGRPAFILQNETDDATAPALSLKNQRDGNGLEDGDALGYIYFTGEDAGGSSETYGSIVGSVVEADHGDEAGQIAISVANDGTERNGITMMADKGTAEEVDVTIANGAASMTTISGNLKVIGTVIGKQYQVFVSNFYDDLNTSKVYIPLKAGGYYSESSQAYQDETMFVAPCDGRIVSITWRTSSIYHASNDDANITVGVTTVSPNITVATAPTVEETETLAVNENDDNHVFHFAFSNSKHFESGENVAAYIQSDTDITGNAYHYVSIVVEWDWNTFLGATSLETDTAI